MIDARRNPGQLLSRYPRIIPTAAEVPGLALPA
jgi:hypothetical protein